jgi:hypothetical protein
MRLRCQILCRTITPGLDIARAAIEQQPVEPGQERERRLPDRWNDDGMAVGDLEQGHTIAGRDGMMHLARRFPGASGNADDDRHVRNPDSLADWGKPMRVGLSTCFSRVRDARGKPGLPGRRIS